MVHYITIISLLITSIITESKNTGSIESDKGNNIISVEEGRL